MKKWLLLCASALTLHAEIDNLPALEELDIEFTPEILQEIAELSHDVLTRKSGCCKDKCLQATSLNVCGNATVGNLTVTYDENVRGNLMVSNNLTVYGTSTFVGKEFFEGGATLNGDLTVIGDISAESITTTTVCAQYFTLCPSPTLATPGVPGLGGDLAFAYSYNTTASVVDSGSAISFSNPGVIASGITASSDNMTIESAGVYRLQFEVRATGDSPIAISIENDGSPIALFASDTITSATLVVTGAALAQLASGDTTLVNQSPNGQITLADDVSGAQTAYLIAERIA